jgi:nitroreductase
MDLFDTINRRFSYRGPYTSAPVPREHLQKIVEAGIHAPSAKNEQVTTFVIVDDLAIVQEIARIVDRPNCMEAKAMIACVTDPRPVVGDWSFATEDCAAATENMWLAITALGYASVWLDGALRRDNRAARVGELLGVPANRTVRVLLPVGVPAEPTAQKEKLPFDRRAWFNCHGQ